MGLSTALDGVTPDELRGLAFLALSDVGHVVTAKVTEDQGGGAVRTWAAGSAVPCRIEPISEGSVGGEAMRGGRIDSRSTDVVTVPAGTVVTPKDRFAIDGRGTFEVTAVREVTRTPTQRFEVARST